LRLYFPLRSFDANFDFHPVAKRRRIRTQPCLRYRALTFTGSYTANGDTLDLTAVADKLSSTQIVQLFADSQNGNSIYYVPILGSALNNSKLKVFNGGGTELTAGTYPAGVSGDIVQLTITARKLQ
jgi:hypothetical protein